MKQIAQWFQSFAMAIGGPGLFVIAMLDSSFLSLPEINDILVVWMVTRHPERLVYYATMATLGSIAGCLILYVLARRGGRPFLAKRLSPERLNRGLRLFQRWGLMAVFIPSILPPPAPFKMFVLLAGLAEVKPRSFIMAIAVGRGLRYFTEGILAVYYGEAAIHYIRENGVRVSIWLAVLVSTGAIAYLLVKRLRRAPATESPPAQGGGVSP